MLFPNDQFLRFYFVRKKISSFSQLFLPVEQQAYDFFYNTPSFFFGQIFIRGDR
jgi:hypothetical protein